MPAGSKTLQSPAPLQQVPPDPVARSKHTSVEAIQAAGKNQISKTLSCPNTNIVFIPVEVVEVEVEVVDVEEVVVEIVVVVLVPSVQMLSIQ